MSARPFLKWAGGKSKVIPEILKHMKSRPLGLNWNQGNSSRYIEPFTGSAASFLGFRRSGLLQSGDVILADINSVLITTLSTISNPKGTESVITRLEEMARSFSEIGNDYYYSCRDHLNSVIIPDSDLDPIDSAAHMIFINKTCFNGLWRINSKGGMNTPLGRPSSGSVNILDKNNLRAFSRLTGDVNFLNQDWSETMSLVENGDLVYVDPPYLPLKDDEYVFRDYSGEGFSDKTHEDLARSCAEAAARGAKVIISNNYSKRIEAMYRKAARDAGARMARARKIKLKRTMKKVSGGQREQVEEILVFMAAKE